MLLLTDFMVIDFVSSLLLVIILPEHSGGTMRESSFDNKPLSW